MTDMATRDPKTGRFLPARAVPQAHADLARAVLADMEPPAGDIPLNLAEPEVPLGVWIGLIAVGMTIGIGLGLLTAPFFEAVARG